MGKFDFYDKGPDRPWINGRLTNAAIIGHTTASSVRLWVRVWEPGTYWLLLSDQAIEVDGTPAVDKKTKKAIALKDGSSQTLPGMLWSQTIDKDTDLTAVFDVTGLEPHQEYHYCVFSDHERTDRWELRPDPQRRKFRTAVNTGQNQSSINFGIFSCHMPYKKNGDVVNTPMWDRFAEELENNKADFVIGVGDQVYTDGNKNVSIWQYLKSNKADLVKEVPTAAEQINVMRSWYRDIYRGYWGFRPLQRVFGRFPTYMMWDDHEIMDGWGSFTKAELANQLDTIWEWEKTELNVKLAHQMFEAARVTYEEYEHSHNPPTAAGVYDYHFTWGRCAFYVLDMRGQRDYNRESNDKILGKDQMKRVQKWLESTEAISAAALFIVSPVPLVHLQNFVVNHLDLPLLGLADDLRDEWAHRSNWEERNKLLSAAFDYSQKQKKRVVFLSGDVHIGAAFRLTRRDQPAARVYQLTSSAITHPVPPLIKLAVRAAGKLGDADEVDPQNRTAFQILHTPFARNNFAIVGVSSEAGDDVGISWNLYGGTGEEDEIVRLKEVRLE